MIRILCRFWPIIDEQNKLHINRMSWWLSQSQLIKDYGLNAVLETFFNGYKPVVLDPLLKPIEIKK